MVFTDRLITRLLIIPVRTFPRIQNKHILFLGLCFGVISLYTMTIQVRAIGDPARDFLTYHRAAQNLLQGESIYSDPNLQSPVATLLFLPLGLLSFQAAGLIWNILSALIYIYLWLLVLRVLGIKLQREWKVLFLGAAMCWYPYLMNIMVGQLSMVICLLVIGGWALLRNHKDLPAGILFGLAAILKIFPGLLIVYLLIRRRRTATLSMVATGLIGFVITALVVGPLDFIQYFFRVAPSSETGDYIAYPLNYSLWAFFRWLLSNGKIVQPLVDLPQLALLLSVLGCTAVILSLFFQAWKIKGSPKNDDIVFSLFILAMLLVTPIMWQHMYPVLVLPLGLLVRESLKHRYSSVRPRALLALILITIPGDELAWVLVNIYAPERIPWLSALLLQWPILGLLLLWGLVVSIKEPLNEPQRPSQLPAQ